MHGAPTLAVPVETWLKVIRDEYLADYIPSGGSAVKFICGSDDDLGRARDGVAAAAAEAGCYYAALAAGQLLANGKKPDLHRIDRLYFAVTQDFDWERGAAGQAMRLLERAGVRWPGGAERTTLAALAEANGRDENDLANEYQRLMTEAQIRDHLQCRPFRAALAGLGRAGLMPENFTPTTQEVLLAWLRGLPGGAATLKKLRIYERIGVRNARHMLASFCHWLPNAGWRGLVVDLDFRAYELTRLPAAAQRSREMLRHAIAMQRPYEELELMAADPFETLACYTQRAFLEMMALLRRFIDEIDRFERFLLVVRTSPRFYDDLEPRNYGKYGALYSRIGTEVHDRNRGNPAASQVHLGDGR
jgi:hypothetical protein